MTANSKQETQAQNQGQNTFTRKKDTKSAHQHPAKNRHAKPQASQRTPEEEKLFQEAKAKAEAAAKARAAAIEYWGAGVEKMSYRQVRGELKRIAAGQFLGESVTPLDSAWAVVADITMQTTKMRDNLAGQLSHYLNPAVAASSPRHTL